jgi:hypothetical protein
MEIWNKVKRRVNRGGARQAPLQPIDIFGLLRAEAGRKKKVFRDKTVIPDHYTVHLCAGDTADLQPILLSLSGELAQAMQAVAKGKGYRFNTTDVRVEFRVSPDVTPGHAAVTGRFRAGGPANAAGASGTGAVEAAADLPVVVLTIESPRQRTRIHSLTLGDHVIGRGVDADIHVPADDRLASKRHCRLSVAADGVRLTDLDSVNGTFCNQARISAAVALKDKDRLSVGATTIEVRFE